MTNSLLSFQHSSGPGRGPTRGTSVGDTPEARPTPLPGLIQRMAAYGFGSVTLRWNLIVSDVDTVG